MFIPLSYIFFTLMGGFKVLAKKDPKHPGYDKHRDTSDGDEEEAIETAFKNYKYLVVLYYFMICLL